MILKTAARETSLFCEGNNPFVTIYVTEFR